MPPFYGQSREWRAFQIPRCKIQFEFNHELTLAAELPFALFAGREFGSKLEVILEVASVAIWRGRSRLQPVRLPWLHVAVRKFKSTAHRRCLKGCSANENFNSKQTRIRSSLRKPHPPPPANRGGGTVGCGSKVALISP